MGPQSIEEHNMRLKNRLALMVAPFVTAMISGCSGPGNHGDSSSPAVLGSGSVREIRTIAQSEQGEMVDLGVKKYSDQTLRLVQATRFKGLGINDDGYVVSYIPVRYATGLEVSPEGTLLDFEVLDPHGTVVSWKEADQPVLTCKMKILPGGARECTNVNCQSPNVCVLTYRYDENGNLISITCDCTTTP